MKKTLLLSATIVLVFGLLMGADWVRFRGPDASGISGSTQLPAEWNATKNVAWKTPLPGFGTSSPILSGDKIFLTCYSGYGLDRRDPGLQQVLQYHVVCVDRTTGKIVWDEATKASLPETKYGGFVALHGYASSTLTTDGEAVYAFFGRSGVMAYGVDGSVLWHVSVGEGTHNWGSGASPILYGNLLIVNASVESQSLVALDKKTGKEVWRAEGIKSSWGTPLLVQLPNGSEELVLSIKGKTLGFDPTTGKQLWSCSSVNDYICPAVVAHKGIVYITGGRRPLTTAIRAGGRGDVTDSHTLWELKKSTKVPTPIYLDGYLYWVDEKGIAVCVKADSGEVVQERRMKISGKGDKVYASLIASGKVLYCVTRQDGTVVLSANPAMEVLAKNSLDDDSIFNATPAMNGGVLFVRSDRFLYCIEK